MEARLTGDLLQYFVVTDKREFTDFCWLLALVFMSTLKYFYSLR